MNTQLNTQLRTDVCIVGGGPAGLVLALQLGRLGCQVVVLEASKNYERSFRGESMQPDTVGILHELGIADKLRQSGWTEVSGISVTERGRELLNIDLAAKPYPYRFITEIPQSTLLDTLFGEISQLTNVVVYRGARVKSLVKDTTGVVRGVGYSDNDCMHTLHAKVVIAADGRFSKLREMSGVVVHRNAMERDFLWCKLPLAANWSNNKARILLNGSRHLIVLPTHPNFLRTGVNIPKGGFSEIRRQGMEAMYEVIDALDPVFGQHFRKHITGWSHVNFLEIFTAVARQWGCPGLILIGDAAHTVTPLLGQGVNLAIEDAMVLAPMLFDHLHADGCVDRQFIALYQAQRQPHIDQVLKVQMFQEKLLTLQKPTARMARRAYYFLVNNISVLQSRLYDSLTYRRQRSLAR